MARRDVDLDWAFSVARRVGYGAADFPLLDGLERRLSALPAYARMQEEERRARAALGL